jgi:hypothetical protein
VVYHLCAALKKNIKEISWLFIESLAKVIGFGKCIGIPFADSIVYQGLVFLTRHKLLFALLTGDWRQLPSQWFSLPWSTHHFHSQELGQHIEHVQIPRAQDVGK